MRVFLDDRDSQTPGWKFAEWELRGVPLRMEIGPKDIEKSAVMVARRDTRTKESMPMDGLGRGDRRRSSTRSRRRCCSARAPSARSTRRASSSYDEFKSVMEGRPGFVIAGWCGSAECEAQIKTDTQATLRNIPFAGADVQGTCVKCGQPSPVRSLVREGVLSSQLGGPPSAAVRRRAPESPPLHCAPSGRRSLRASGASVRLTAA